MPLQGIDQSDSIKEISEAPETGAKTSPFNA